VSSVEKVPAVETCVDFVSGIATRAERFFGGKKKQQVVGNKEPREEMELMEKTDHELVTSKKQAR
jgi:hypothetical protein